MPKKLKFYLDNGEKVYTLEDEINGNATLDAHYKFVRLRDGLVGKPRENGKKKLRSDKD